MWSGNGNSNGNSKGKRKGNGNTNNGKTWWIKLRVRNIIIEFLCVCALDCVSRCELGCSCARHVGTFIIKCMRFQITRLAAWILSYPFHEDPLAILFSMRSMLISFHSPINAQHHFYLPCTTVFISNKVNICWKFVLFPVAMTDNVHFCHRKINYRW